MRRQRWRTAVAGIATGVLVGGLVVAAPAAAFVPRWIDTGGDFDPTVGLASNLNTSVVVAVGRADGRVRYRDDATSAGSWVDIGRPVRSDGSLSTVRRLATSASHIYAVGDDGGIYHYDPATGMWPRIADGMADLLASRSGQIVSIPNQPPTLNPDLYAVDQTQHVWRFDGQGWSMIGASAATRDGLAERGRQGSTQLFLLTAAHDRVLRWNGTAGGWTTIGGPAGQIAADKDSLAMTDRRTGKMKYFNDASGTFVELAMPAGSEIPMGPNGRIWLGDRTIYYRTASPDLLWATRLSISLGPTSAVVLPWWLVSKASVADVAPHDTTARSNAVVLANAGWTSALTWGYLEPFTNEVDLTVQPDTDIAISTALMPDWTGYLHVVGLTGRVPDGLNVNVHPTTGRLLLWGRIGTVGRFQFGVSMEDDAGGSFLQFVDLTVSTAAAPPFVPRRAGEVSSLSVANCLPSHELMPVWFIDHSAIDLWQELRTPASSGLIPGPGGERCEPTGPAVVTVPVPVDHVVEVAAIAPRNPHCGLLDTPRVLGCVVMRRFVTGTAGGPPVTITVT
jgi:hypothetical protein